MRKILIVDDDVDFCFFMKKNIERKEGFEVTVCTESGNAFKLIKESNPDIILIDIMMPGKSGMDIVSELKKNKQTKDIPRAFLSGIIKEDKLQNGDNMIGGEYCIAKPIKVGELIDIVDKLIKDHSKVTSSSALSEEKRRVVTFLTREQVDFLDKLGKDSLFYLGSKISRSQILSELVDLLVDVKINMKDLDLQHKDFRQAVADMICSKHLSK